MSEETTSVQQQAADVPEEAEGFSEKEKAANRPGAEKPETETEKRDWVEETYKCFVKDAKDIDPTDPVKAVEAYFQKNATVELKARCKKEGKDAKGCWKFIEAVARKALNGHNGHIDPAVVYAIAMHYFEDVPVDWDEKKTAQARPSGQGKATKPKKQQADNSKAAKPKKPAETPSEVKKEKAKAKKAAKPKQEQGFFFDLLETPQESEAKE